MTRKEMHLDGSWDPEVKGKASNVKFAVKKAWLDQVGFHHFISGQVCEDIQERSEYDAERLVCSTPPII